MTAGPDERPPAAARRRAREGPRPRVRAAEAPSAPAPDTQVIDIIGDELGLARAQLDSGLPGLAEGTLRRRIGLLDAEGVPAASKELDALRALLAEALWRLGRPLAARAALDAVRPSSLERRRPVSMMIEAEALAAAGEPDRAAGMMERVVAAIGVDEAWRLLAGSPSRLAWPLPAALQPEPRRAGRPPWSTAATDESPDAGADASADATASEGRTDVRIAQARARLEAARSAYTRGEPAAGDRELALAVRLDAAVAAAGVSMLEPTLGEEPAADRLLLYGDLLRAAGREAEAAEAYGHAAGARH